jgi:hypothetical protein
MIVLCIKEEREDKALHRKIFESRKRFLKARKNPLDGLLCSRVYQKQLFGGCLQSADCAGFKAG